MKGDLFGSALEEEVACVEREIKLRKQVYPRRVAQGRMSQPFADKEISTMEAVLERLRGLQ